VLLSSKVGVFKSRRVREVYHELHMSIQNFGQKTKGKYHLIELDMDGNII
jgi:hypothetical protein